MKKIFRSNLVLLIILSFFFITKSFSQDVKEIRFNKMQMDRNFLMEDKIQIHLKIDTTQNRSAKGLIFSFRIINSLNKDIDVNNPLNYLQITLLNNEGYNIQIPEFHKVINEKSNVYHDSFKVLKVTLNNKILNDSSSIKTISIPAQSNYEALIKIEDVQATINGKPTSDLTKVKVDIGSYKLLITSALVGNGISNQIFQVGPVEVSYH